MMTIPRKLGLLNFRGEWQLTQHFIDLSSQLNKTLYNGEKSLDAGGSWTVSLPPGEAVEITLLTDIDVDTLLSLTFANDEGESLSIGFDSSAFGGFFIDRHNTHGFDNPYYTDRFSYALPPNTTSTNMHIILDNSSIELLAAQGMASGTALYFTRAAFTSLTVHAVGGKAGCPAFGLTPLVQPTMPMSPLNRNEMQGGHIGRPVLAFRCHQTHLKRLSYK
ncbi:GH32 C-terminal domain-containing protein [Enterobacter sp. UPMP2052]